MADEESVPLSVFLVEDSAIMLRLLTRLLGAEAGVAVLGYERNAFSAIAEITRRKPDVVIVDVALENGSGFDVLSAIHEMRDPKPTCIVLSNLSDAPYRAAAARLGVKHYFDKSTDINAAIHLIRQLRPISRKADRLSPVPCTANTPDGKAASSQEAVTASDEQTMIEANRILDALTVLSHEIACDDELPGDHLVLSAKKVRHVCEAIAESVAALKRLLRNSVERRSSDRTQRAANRLGRCES